MKHLLSATLKLLITITIFGAVAVLAQSTTYFRAIEGKWEGTLEYLDYTSGKRVTMKAIVTVVPAADGNSATVSTIYDDFGKIYRSKGVESIDQTAAKFNDDGIIFDIDSTAPGKLVLLGKSLDGNTVEPTRKTIEFDRDNLVILKETRSPWRFRNSYTLRRVPPPPPTVMLSVDKMKQDLALFEKALTAIHPGVYRYLTPDRLRAEIAAESDRISAPMPETEFFIVVSRLASLLKCGHTYTNFYNQDEKLRNRFFAGRSVLPFYFDVVDGRFIVTANASSKELPIGSEILRINGIAVKEIINKLLTVTKADGTSTLGHRIDSISLRREEAESQALFDWYFPLFFPIKDEIFDIEAVSFTTRKPSKFSILAMTRTERTTEMAKTLGPTPTYDDGWKYELRPDGIAYLRIGNSITWRLKRVRFREFLAEAFADMRSKGADKLIVDVRGNGGGSMDPGFELARYLAPRKLGKYAESRRLVRNVAPQTDLDPFLDTYSDELKATIRTGVPSVAYRPVTGGFYEIVGRESYPEVEPYPNRFTGRTVVISDASNASATYQMLEFIQSNKLATIVGQTTGGNRQGINGGNYFFLRLPNSSIEVDIPVFFQSPTRPAPDVPVIPEVIVNRRPEDIGNKLDRELEAAVGVLTGRTQNR